MCTERGGLGMRLGMSYDVVSLIPRPPLAAFFIAVDHEKAARGGLGMRL